MTENNAAMCTGRCYCGAITFQATQKPITVAYCHCDSCKRATGAPVAAFAAFDKGAVLFTPDAGREISVTPGVRRTFCATCGSLIAGFYAYLPGQVYIWVGVLDQADDFAPELHTHAGERMTWLHIDDRLERVAASGTAQLKRTAP